MGGGEQFFEAIIQKNQSADQNGEKSNLGLGIPVRKQQDLDCRFRVLETEGDRNSRSSGLSPVETLVAPAHGGARIRPRFSSSGFLLHFLQRL
ncbi:hypothetical protein ACLOJK_015736 [Asimina triloba]